MPVCVVSSQDDLIGEVQISWMELAQIGSTGSYALTKSTDPDKQVGSIRLEKVSQPTQQELAEANKASRSKWWTIYYAVLHFFDHYLYLISLVSVSVCVVLMFRLGIIEGCEARKDRICMWAPCTTELL